jgi:hypothetical protein
MVAICSKYHTKHIFYGQNAELSFMLKQMVYIIIAVVNSCQYVLHCNELLLISNDSLLPRQNTTHHILLCLASVRTDVIWSVSLWLSASGLHVANQEQGS